MTFALGLTLNILDIGEIGIRTVCREGETAWPVGQVELISYILISLANISQIERGF